ncbi:5,10-methylenetetrahydrofolate reductase [Desulfobacter hydrogenophilus]|uniref:Methylenetetrahydrofolate reductase n=1 Tax=Desulfobacter hydrogenophilus TaxID=2291 RepID=A0A328FCB1_9BACT|nr:methylenetetrahydrofolate reductase [Desulfobacter hydrogenophilus]NDY72908.1 5,10-methylenetetrahydrofolate reductase [Desulfobacter hydrogenophilus]QBH11822.1 5,10-methylenetetrahydrofolate reductase [Desulfobacter hydrogenophilus]RAM01052.1 5,10-methylenetetrahydrofolate reductase [Desulfobacter hydrogenophilus]
MRVTQLYKDKQPAISFEFFPFRDDKTQASFNNTIDALSPLSPDYFSVTFGAGGSTRDGSYATAKILVDKNFPTVAYIAGFGLAPDEVRDILDKYKALGIETIFVIRGDQPKDADFKPHPDSFAYACDLIKFIKDNYDFTLGCAGYPEGHVQAESLEADIKYLKMKQDAGAQYVVAQFFYDNEFYFSYVNKCRDAGVTIPIIPGIMPVYTLKLINILTSVCGASIPAAMQARIDAVDKGDKDAVLNLGIDYAAEQCKDLLAKGVPGLHIYTMNRSRSTKAIVEALKKENLI